MILEKGDIWSIYGKTSLFLITTNATIKADGSLVMGRGLAFFAKLKIPSIDLAFGKLISNAEKPYGIVIWKRRPEQSVAAFQVKAHYSEVAKVELIEFSTLKLRELALKYPSCRFDLNFPGIGNGRLSKQVVLPIIKTLPGNVHIWSR